ncbi:MAG: hypothetical protein AB7D41_11110 [Arcobacter sp.]|uniref:hypothetical protein n=1 Tax=Arcobacter sp. TaxID=1872629 RepID=UPI003D069896
MIGKENVLSWRLFNKIRVDEKITQPTYCSVSREWKLMYVGGLSIGVFGKHPNE